MIVEVGDLLLTRVPVTPTSVMTTVSSVSALSRSDWPSLTAARERSHDINDRGARGDRDKRMV